MSTLAVFQLHVYNYGGRSGRACIVVGFTITGAISAYHHQSCEFEFRSCKVYFIQYVIKFLSDL
jgi:hypothetical protein